MFNLPHHQPHWRQCTCGLYLNQRFKSFIIESFIINLQLYCSAIIWNQPLSLIISIYLCRGLTKMNLASRVPLICLRRTLSSCMPADGSARDVTWLDAPMALISCCGHAMISSPYSASYSLVGCTRPALHSNLMLWVSSNELLTINIINEMHDSNATNSTVCAYDVYLLVYWVSFFIGWVSCCNFVHQWADLHCCLSLVVILIPFCKEQK